MRKFDDNKWLKDAIAYISGEMTEKAENAFNAKLKENSKLSQKFELLKKIWFIDNKDLKMLDNRWDSIKQQLIEEIAFCSYIRKANSEQPDKISVSILKNTENEISTDKLQKLEKLANSIFTDDEKCWIAPRKDIWSGVKHEIIKELQHSKRIHPQKSERKPKKTPSMLKIAANKRKFNRNVLITGIASAAAVISLFLILFVFTPDTSTKYATDDSADYNIPDEKEIPKILPDTVDVIDVEMNKVVLPEDKPNNDNEVKKDDFEVVEKSIDDKKDVVDNKIPDNVENKKESDDVDDDKPKIVIENKTDKKDDKENTPEKKEVEDIIRGSETQEFVYRAKYIDFDPEKLKFTTPDKFGIRLNFMYDSSENKFNVYDVNLPTKESGFKVTVDGKNNLLADLNNDGVFESRFSNSTYKNYHLIYDAEKSVKFSYRLKFVRNKTIWSIMPASGFIAKKSYMKKSILLIDANINGMFNDTNKDYVQFGDEEIQILSTLNCASDNWVKIQPKASGQSIKILKTIPQNIGLLRIESEYQENVMLKWLSIKGDVASITRTSDSVNDIMLPIGEYTIVKGIVGNGKSAIEFSGNPDFKFKIFQNNATIVKIGGELTLSLVKSAKRDNKMIINRENLILVGQNGEIYNKILLKNGSSRINGNNFELLNIKNSFIKSEDVLNYQRNLNIQSTVGSNLIYISIPKFKEPGLYLLYLVEEKFSRFLTGKSVTSVPIKINVVKPK
ncbi:MAG: hypothetical protein K8S87_05385 [Planctomycetes bacterium]|nr:hypothetical protein [Planctomycetota bacterium]